jgi:hypothetical protein
MTKGMRKAASEAITKRAQARAADLDDAENTAPRTFTKPHLASSAAITRNER